MSLMSHLTPPDTLSYGYSQQNVGAECRITSPEIVTLVAGVAALDPTTSISLGSTGTTISVAADGTAAPAGGAQCSSLALRSYQNSFASSLASGHDDGHPLKSKVSTVSK